MKILALFLTFFSFLNMSSAAICSNEEGSMVYDSATTVKNAVVIENPRLIITNKFAYCIDGNDCCKALGYSSGSENDVITVASGNLIAIFFVGTGELYQVRTTTKNTTVIKSLTCQKR